MNGKLNFVGAQTWEHPNDRRVIPRFFWWAPFASVPRGEIAAGDPQALQSDILTVERVLLTRGSC
jgi:hypothetical protein